MNILIIGGGAFLGRHLTRAAQALGHRTTHFNRGRTGAAFYASPDGRAVERLIGDRDGDPAALTGRRWDAVIDTCAYFPHQVAAAARALAGAAPCYTLISSVNQYADFSPAPVDEATPSAEPPPDAPEPPPLNAVTYGFLKAGCEAALKRHWPGRPIVLRPGYLVGPEDHSHRFAYWTRRMMAGGDVLAPGGPQAPWQFIDVRDLCDWLIRRLEVLNGVYNVTGPAAAPTTAGMLLERMAAAAGAGARPAWRPVDYLAAAPGGARWLDIADWAAPPDHQRWLYTVSNARALAAGLTFRDIALTMADTLDWLNSVPPAAAAALDPATEAQLLRG